MINSSHNPVDLTPCFNKTPISVFDVLLPFLFVVTSLALYIYRRYSLSHESPRIDISDADFLRLPTQKVHTVRGLCHLAGVLTQIGSWAFVFAWRLESSILQHGQTPSTNDTPLYEIICPALSLLPWVGSRLDPCSVKAIVGGALGVIWSSGVEKYGTFVNDRLAFFDNRSTCS